MRLQLDSSTLTPADNSRVAATASPGTSSASRVSGSTAAGGDSIGISGTSVALSRLSGERAERIQQLTGAVRSGSYRISGAAISKAIIAQGFTQLSQQGSGL